ncbi:MAG TPA: sugar phosphate isomerase/epimerase [Firmicutes bacterium]|nr:sugar phosphate isomerase/epimerase [Bacillota bacterium]
MKLGFLTACLPNVPLEELVKWAADHGFEALEVAAWPIDNARDYAGSSIDVASLTPEESERIKRLFAENNLVISSLAYYDNNLHRDPEVRARFHSHLKRVIDAARMLDVGLVGTFVGRNIDRTVEENLEEYEKVFRDLVSYAESREVRLMFENCPMEGWQKPGVPGNLAYSPELWRELFRLMPKGSVGLNLDPSHLHWLGIDYHAIIPEFKERIFHTHAKDTEILKDGMNQYGIYGRQLGPHIHGGGWWRYRMPGLGEIDWRDFVATLVENGFDGTLSIEHEDPIYSGTEEMVKKGLVLAQRHLAPLII